MRVIQPGASEAKIVEKSSPTTLQISGVSSPAQRSAVFVDRSEINSRSDLSFTTHKKLFGQLESDIGVKRSELVEKTASTVRGPTHKSQAPTQPSAAAAQMDTPANRFKSQTDTILDCFEVIFKCWRASRCYV